MDIEKDTINKLLDQLNFAGEHILNAKTAIEDAKRNVNVLPEYMENWEKDTDSLYAQLERLIKLVYLKNEELNKPGNIFY